MKKIPFFFLFVSIYSWAGLQQVAGWDSSPVSVQGALFSILQRAAEIDADSKAPQDLIKAQESRVEIQSDQSSLICEKSKSRKAYRCIFEGDFSTWTMDAGSTQAVLFEAMQTLVEMDPAKSYPVNLIREDEGRLILQDESTSMICASAMLGDEAVQHYRCEL